MIDNCKLVYVDGVATAFDDRGEKSSLFQEALAYTEGNQEEAVKIWAATQTQEFDLEVGEESPNLETVLRFLNNRVDEPKTLSTEELKEVSLMMSDLGVTSIEEFTETMNNMFQPKGYYEVDGKKLLKSGLYSVDDISNLDHVAVKGFLDKLNYYNEHKSYSLESAPTKAKIQLRNTTAKKNPIGAYPLVSEQELVEYIIDNSEDLTETNILKTIGESPFAQVLEDKKAMKAIMSILSGKTKVSKLFFDGEKFTADNIDTFVTLRNTLLADADPIELEADLEFIEGISETVWLTKQKEVKAVLKEIEKTAMKYNIDIIGISDLAKDREGVLGILSALDDMLLSPSVENIKRFAQRKDEKIKPNKPYTVVQLKEKYRNYNIVKVDTTLSDEAMLQSGLVRIGSNGLYHRVQRASTEDMYGVVYDKVMDNSLIIPSTFFPKDLNIKDPQNLEVVMEGIQNYINSRGVSEEMSLLQTIFEHDKIETFTPQEIETDEDYLKTEFVSDFYNYILEQKQQKTDLYNKVLKYFSITDSDIVLDSLETPDISNIKYEKELRDYARLKKFGQIKQLEKNSKTNQDLEVLNDPKKVKEDVGTTYVMSNDGYILTEPNPNIYFKVGGKLYRKVLDKSNGTLYKEVQITNNAIYFDNNLNFSHSREEAESAHKNLSKSLRKTPIKTAEEISEMVNLSNKITPIQYQIIGEQGASRMIEYKQQLDRAKELEKEGKTPAQIELETGWYKYKGDWRTIPKEVVESFQIKDRTVNKELTLKQVLGEENTLFNFYPEIGETKVIFLGETYEGISVPNDIQQALGLYNEERQTIYVNLFFPVNNNGLRERATEEQVRKVLGHEVNHVIQSIEGFPTGGGLFTIVLKTQEIINSGAENLLELYEDIKKFNLDSLNESEKVIVNSTKKALKEIDIRLNLSPLEEQYNHILGEIDSNIVEDALDNPGLLYSQLFQRAAISKNISLDDIIILRDSNNLKLDIAQKDSKETVEEVINKLKQTGLSSEVFQLNTTQLQEKLKELGVSDDIAMQVAMQIKNGYYSNAQTAFTNLKDKNVKNVQGWLKALTDVQKNGGVKNVNQELEWIGLEDFLNEYVKENNLKNGNIPAPVVEEYILLNQIEIVDVSKEGLRLIEPGILEDETYNNINEELSRRGIEDEEGLLNQWYYAEEDKEQKWTNLVIFLGNNNIDLEYLIEKSETDSLVPDDTKYSGYQLKGGKNYKEVLLTMPFKNTLFTKRDELSKKRREAFNSEKYELANELDNQISDITKKLIEQNAFGTEREYKSSHWDEANILAHVRMNEKTLPDGRRVLIVNEIQSDWAQDGRKKGFSNKKLEDEREKLRLAIQEKKIEVDKKQKDIDSLKPLSKEEVEELEQERRKWRNRLDTVRNNREFEEAENKIIEINDKIFNYESTKEKLKNELYELKFEGDTSLSALELNLYEFDQENSNVSRGVENMPYKNTDQWVGLVTRRVMQMASQEGYDGIAFATGQQSADMYSLSQQVDKIDITPQGDVKAVYISMKNNADDTVFINQEGVITESASGAYNGKKAEEVLGKDLTRKILETEEETTLEGEGLEFGGEGMKTFYDKIVPKVVQKEAQRFDKNAKLETVDFSEQPLRVTTDESGNRMLVDYTGEVVDSQYGNRFTTDQEYINAFQNAYNNSQGVTINKDKLSLGVQPYLPLTQAIKDSVSQGIPQFQKALSKQGINLIPNGFIYKDQVFLNSETITPDLVFHEFQHLFLNWSKEARPDIYNRGIELARKELEKGENSEIKEIISYVKQTQPNLKGEALENEIITEFVGRYSKRMMDEQKAKSPLMQWLSDFWASVKEMLGITEMTPAQVANLTLEEYAKASVVTLSKGEQIKGQKAQEYFTREADRLPLTLAVFSTKPFQDLQGKQVNPVTIQQLLNKTGIKQIEKDLINQVLSDNYSGQKRIDYDEFETTVRANIMPLERLTTSSYASYGMDNLGDGNYGEAKTLILNSPIEHGVTGHFSGDFKASGRKNIKYVPKQLNDNTWVAVEEDYESQANNNNIYNFVGTAGTKEAVDAWIENYSSVKPYYVADKSDIKKPIKFFDTYKEAKQWASENGDSLIAEDSEGINTDINKGMFGHIRVWQDGEDFYVAELQSDYFQKNKATNILNQNDEIKRLIREKNIIESTQPAEYARENNPKKEGESKDEYVARITSIMEDYKRNAIEASDKKIEDKRKELLSKATPQEKQFIASQKIWEQRMVREAIKEASLSGATSLRFPTPYTLSVIEGYVEGNGTGAIQLNSEGTTEIGDTLEYLGEDYTIISEVDYDDGVRIVSTKDVREINIESFIEEMTSNDMADVYVSEGDEFYSNNTLDNSTAQRILDDALEQKAEEEGTELNETTLIITSEIMKEIEETIRREIKDAVEYDVVSYFSDWGYANIVEKDGTVYYTDERVESEYVSLTQNSMSKDEFTIANLDNTQQTVARKYEEIAEILRKERGDNFEVVTDENGFDWYETRITPEESQQPVIAFQKIVYDKRAENRVNTFQLVNDFGFTIKNIYPKSKEQEIRDKFDECRI